jgi:hypothetical protein
MQDHVSSLTAEVSSLKARLATVEHRNSQVAAELVMKQMEAMEANQAKGA